MHNFPWRHGLKNGKIKKKNMNKYLNNGTATLVWKIKERETGGKKALSVFSSSSKSDIHGNTGEALRWLMPVKCL